MKTSSKGEIEAIPPAASPSLSPQRTASSKQDTTEKLVDRLNEVETRSGSDESSSTRVTPQQHSEPARKFLNGTFSDEHSLIAQYCQKLHNGDLISSVPDSPRSIMAEIDAAQSHIAIDVNPNCCCVCNQKQRGILTHFAQNFEKQRTRIHNKLFVCL